MPLYEYQCSSCAHRFERIVKFSDPPLKICPKCGKNNIKQLISAPAVQFKGSGWYVTDYAHKNSSGSSTPARSEGRTETASAPNSGATSGASSDSGSSDKSSSDGTSVAGAGNAISGSSGSSESDSAARDSR